MEAIEDELPAFLFKALEDWTFNDFIEAIVWSYCAEENVLGGSEEADFCLFDEDEAQKSANDGPLAPGNG